MTAPRRRSSAPALLVGIVVAAAVTAQTPTTLHAAWLQEVLDLDAAGAAAAYHRLAADRQAPQIERQVAIARATELRQLGIGRELPRPDLTILPEVLQQHFQQSPQASPPVVALELEAGAGSAATVHEFFARTEVPQLRPLVVATVLAAAEQSNPSAAERLRQQRARFSPWSNDPARVLDRIRANEIVRAELDGRAEDAAALRRREFPSWRPPTWPTDAAAAWEQARSNLLEWQRERQLTSSELDLLARLQAALTAAAAADPAAALRLLDRMPLFAERLRVGIPSAR